MGVQLAFHVILDPVDRGNAVWSPIFYLRRFPINLIELRRREGPLAPLPAAEGP